MAVRFGTYVGDGNNGRVVSAIDTVNNLFIIGQDITFGLFPFPRSIMHWKSPDMGATFITPLSADNTDLPATFDATCTLSGTNFIVNDSILVNELGSTYYFISMPPLFNIVSGVYEGDGTSSRVIPTPGINPEFVICLRRGNRQGTFGHKTAVNLLGFGTRALGSTDDVATITEIQDGGFTVGFILNGTDSTHDFIAFSRGNIGSYTGDSAGEEFIQTDNDPAYLWQQQTDNAAITKYESSVNCHPDLFFNFPTENFRLGAQEITTRVQRYEGLGFIVADIVAGKTYYWFSLPAENVAAIGISGPPLETGPVGDPGNPGGPFQAGPTAGYTPRDLTMFNYNYLKTGKQLEKLIKKVRLV